MVVEYLVRDAAEDARLGCSTYPKALVRKLGPSEVDRDGDGLHFLEHGWLGGVSAGGQKKHEEDRSIEEEILHGLRGAFGSGLHRGLACSEPLEQLPEFGVGVLQIVGFGDSVESDPSGCAF